ncbi:ribosome modulation factor [Mycolicibacterium sp. 22603]|uniref:ribosome modulation factor n=1 Tax=Mycolicibacterium sp. 22603 TaxID=3453950 RepID=UPI003F83EDEC
MTNREEYTFALYAGSVADPGDRNPYAGRSLVLAKLRMRGYRRMLSIRIDTGPAMQK